MILSGSSGKKLMNSRDFESDLELKKTGFAEK